MAIWQYDFSLVEKRSLEDLQAANQFIEREVLNEEPFWLYSNQDKNMFYELSQILGRNKSWCNEIDLYGSEESNCVEVVFNNDNKVVSVQARIDFSKPYENLLTKFASFCSLKELVIIDADNLLCVPPNGPAIDHTIRSSERWRNYHGINR